MFTACPLSLAHIRSGKFEKVKLEQFSRTRVVSPVKLRCLDTVFFFSGPDLAFSTYNGSNLIKTSRSRVRLKTQRLTFPKIYRLP